MSEANEKTPEEGSWDQTPTEPNPWYRLPYLVLFAIVFQIVEIIVGAIVIVQFILRVATGRPNERLRSFGAGISRYLREVVAFVTYDSDAIPYPFGPWPKA